MNKIVKILLLTICFFVSITLNAQVFRGFNAFKEIIEYEGQRYLMENIYQIKSHDFDKLKIEKTISETDSEEGFMFVLTSYTFNGKSGVVITSFNATNFQNTKHRFVNLHLTQSEFENLNATFLELEQIQAKDDEHILRQFNGRLIIDVYSEENFIYYSLWVDKYSRHTFTPTKWDRTVKKFHKFIKPSK